MKACLFVIVVFLRLNSFAQQCDPSFMFEKIEWPKSPFTLLKPYAIPVHEIKGAPFSVQYSYLFEKGSMYGLYLKSIGKTALPVKLTLTSSDNVVMNLDTMENYNEDGVLLSFFAPTSDAYNLNLHSPQSFEGCLVFYVSVHRPQVKPTKEGWKMPLPSTEKEARKPLGKDSLIRKFEFRHGSQSRHAIELEEGQLYALQVPDEQSAKTLCIHVRSNAGAPIKTYIVPQEKGYIYYIRPSERGIHRFDFNNPSDDKPAVALLLMAKERFGLPK